MTDKKHTDEYFNTWREVKLSETRREDIKTALLEHARFHGVQEAAQSTSAVSWFVGYRRTFASAFAVLLLMVTTGTSYAARGALPGDTLYPVKTGFNERVQAAFAVNANAKVAFQSELAEKRAVEAKALKARGTLTQEQAARLKAEIKQHQMLAANIVTTHDIEVTSDVKERFTLAINEFNTAVEGDVSLAIATDERVANEAAPVARTATMMAADTRADASAGATTMLATAPINEEKLIADTQTRIESLYELLDTYRNEIDPVLRAKLDTKLDAATEALGQAKQRQGDQARTLALSAADDAGKVESVLSLLGSVEIDRETGAITSVDFSNPPKLDQDRDMLIESILNAKPIQPNNDTPTVEGVPPTSVDGGGSIELQADPDTNMSI